MREILPGHLTRGLGPWIKTVARPALREVEVAAARGLGIRDVELLSSYNWVAPDHPATIMVPGGPRVLRSGLKPPVPLAKTVLHREVYPTNTRLPLAAPTQPMFQAVRVLRPECRFNSVDVVTSRNVVELLLKFCGNDSHQFRLNATVVQDSLVLDHCPKSIGSNHVGLHFEEAMSAFPAGLEHSDSHWRILRYSMGQLTWVVHYEADATAEPYGRCDDQAPVVIPAPNYESANVVVQGHLTPQHETVEMKSKGSNHMWSPLQLTSKTYTACTGYLLLGDLYQDTVQRATMKPLEADHAWYPTSRAMTGKSLDALPRFVKMLKRAVRRAPSGQAGLVFRPYPWVRVDVYDLDPQGGYGPLVSQEMKETFWVKRPNKAAGGAASR
ncbi:hypothetical protein PG985_001660 [Apiospora marii]|uniref:uncharacterized protein n=1 Tax=Apiospora marii TaxID=335849 RepID=UPI00312E3FFB